LSDGLIPPSKESYRLCKKYYETEEEVRAQQRAVELLMNEKINGFTWCCFDPRMDSRMSISVRVLGFLLVFMNRRFCNAVIVCMIRKVL
jgi:hypothetical protein